ncbi:MAG: single-stranded-DNA-specific exonuclease RecJ [Fimbriimonadaceae bacterium]
MPGLGQKPLKKIWNVLPRDRDREKILAAELGLPELAVGVLLGRGLTEPDAIRAFLDPRLEDLHDPKLLPDFRPACDEILGARERRERIFIHGDYDVDGVTSAALFFRYLRTIGCDVVGHVPHRIREGYGIHLDAVEKARQSGAKLFLTCDCGVSAHEQVQAAREAGMRVVVTDHHTVGNALPEASAVINPHRKDSVYPFEDLSGVGVAFKLCAGLTEEIGLPLNKYYRAYIDLATLGTIADMMPLRGENRIIARHGLAQLPHTNKIGLKALMKAAAVEPRNRDRLRAYDVSFQLGPRLNAAGRLDDADIAYRLLVTSDPLEAEELARTIDELNRQRQSDQKKIIEQAIAQVESSPMRDAPIIVVAGEGWHAGVVGIVAGKLVEYFHRPAFVLAVDREANLAKGSGRSISGFNLYDIIKAHDGLVSGGGHAAAAGMSTAADKIEEVVQKFTDYAKERITEDMLVKEIRADAEAEASELTLALAEAFERMEPFGNDNPTPVLCVRGVQFAQLKPTRHTEHPQVVLVPRGAPSVRASAFGMGPRLSQEAMGWYADCLVQIGVNEWNGRREPQWQLKDFDKVDDAPLRS